MEKAENRKVRVFISYPHESENDLNLLVSHLRGNEIDPLVGVVSPGQNISTKIREILSAADCCVVLLNEYTLKSSWCMAELGAFWGAKRTIIGYPTGGGKEVPPLLLGLRLAKTPAEVVEACKEEHRVRPSCAVRQVFAQSDSPEFRQCVRDYITTAREVCMIGAGLKILSDAPMMKDLIQNVTSGACTLDICMANPFSPAVETRLIEEETGEDPIDLGRAGIRNRLEKLVEEWGEIQPPAKIQIRVFTHYPTFALLIVDDNYFVYPYGYAKLGEFSFVLHFSKRDRAAKDVIDFLDGHRKRVMASSMDAKRVMAARRAIDGSFVDGTKISIKKEAFGDTNQMLRLALYFVPPKDGALYKFGSEILGYDVHSYDVCRMPPRRPKKSSWTQMVANAWEFGFHLTICDALYFLTEAERKRAVEEVKYVAREFKPFDLNLEIRASFPDPNSISLALKKSSLCDLPEDSSGNLEALHDELVHRVYRRAAASNYTLGQAELTRDKDTERAGLLIKRYNAPYILRRFFPHFTLLTNVPPEAQAETCEKLKDMYAARVGMGRIRVDKIAVMAKPKSTEAWVIEEEIALG